MLLCSAGSGPQTLGSVTLPVLAQSSRHFEVKKRGLGHVSPAAAPTTAGQLDCRTSVRGKPGPRRTRQRCSGPVRDRPSTSRPVPSRQHRRPGRRGPGRARTVANRAQIALTGAVRTGPYSSYLNRLNGHGAVSAIDPGCAARQPRLTVADYPLPDRQLYAASKGQASALSGRVEGSCVIRNRSCAI